MPKRSREACPCFFSSGAETSEAYLEGAYAPSDLIHMPHGWTRLWLGPHSASGKGIIYFLTFKKVPCTQMFNSYTHIVGENIFGTIKIQNNYGRI